MKEYMIAASAILALSGCASMDRAACTSADCHPDQSVAEAPRMVQAPQAMERAAPAWAPILAAVTPQQPVRVASASFAVRQEFYFLQLAAYRDRKRALVDARAIDDNLLRMVTSSIDGVDWHILFLGLHPNLKSATEMGDDYVRKHPGRTFWVRHASDLKEELYSGSVVVPG